MIVDRILDYLGGQREHVSDESVAIAGRLIGHSLKRNMGKPREPGARLPSPSSRWGCKRRMFYDADPSLPREPLTPRALITFTIGDMLEQAGIVMARQALGDQVITPDPMTGEQREVRHEIGGYEYVGHVDMTIHDPVHGEIPVDWKSMSEISFEMFKAAALDPTHKWWAENRDSYVMQVRAYMIAMNAPRGYLVGICKNTGHMAEVEIRNDRMENERFARIFIETHEAIRANALPDRPEWAAEPVYFKRRRLPDGTDGPGHELDTKATPGFSWQCGYCTARPSCFPGFSVVPMSRPVYRRPLDHKRDPDQ